MSDHKRQTYATEEVPSYFFESSPPAISPSIISVTVAIDLSRPLKSPVSISSRLLMSCQEVIRMPMLIVTGCTGAVGQITRRPGRARWRLVNAGAQEAPASPRPWRKIRVAVCAPLGSMIVDGFSLAQDMMGLTRENKRRSDKRTE